MQRVFGGFILGFCVVALLALTTDGRAQAASQRPPQNRAAQIPRLAGRPDMNGVWQVMNTANWDIQGHPARQGSVLQLGAAFSVPAGHGVVEGNEIPYKPAMLAKKKENGANWMTLDPEVKCYLPGVPRATYQPYPFQIVQGTSDLVIAYEFASTSRAIYMNRREDAPVETWMGVSNGRWEGDTLVVDVTGLNDQTWFDRAGNFHSDKAHVVERYTMLDPDHIWYEATIDDPEVFTRPWKMSMPLYRHIETSAELLEYKCVEFVEDLMYGHLSKPKTR